jgi:type IV pilus assembly protein PilQ
MSRLLTLILACRFGVKFSGEFNYTLSSCCLFFIPQRSTRPSLSDRLNVNLPVANPSASIGMHIAKLANGTLIDLELTALEEENKGEIIASPRITAANQQKARIEQGTEIPYVESASSGATTVSFKKAVLSLEVTPHITPDNKVILNLIITQDTRGDTVQTGTGPAVAIDTQQIETQVLVENGQTVVLGGIFQQQIINSTKKVPLLGDLPYVGRLFKSTSEFNEKREPADFCHTTITKLHTHTI